MPPIDGGGRDTGGGGGCVGVDCSAMDDECNMGVCNPATGDCEQEPLADGTTCDDGDDCTMGDTCGAGTCDGTPRDCSAMTDACNTGTCSPATGACVATPRADGATCDDGDACTTGDACTAGSCGGTAMDCSGMTNACNVGACNPATGACAAMPRADGTTCDDGYLCTSGDVCTGGACGGAAVDCSAMTNMCNVGACDPASGGCLAMPVANGTACSDGATCTTGDVCTGGVCGGTPVDCSAMTNMCNVGMCDPATGACAATPVANGTTCSDGVACTTGDVCTGGACGGTAVDCSAMTNACNVGTCNPATGACQAVRVPDGTSCGAGGQVCTMGVCRPGNDDRLSATVVTLSTAETTVTGNTTDASLDGTVPPCACAGAGNVWYRFTLAAREIVYLDTAGSAYDTSISIRDSAGTPITGACNDDGGCAGSGWSSGLNSRLSVILNAGTYYVSISGCGVGAFTLHLQHISTTIGSFFYSAAISGTATTSTSLVGTSAATSVCGGSASGEDVRWFQTCGGQQQFFSLCMSDGGTFLRRNAGGTNFDPSMYIYSGQTGAQVVCNDDGGSMGGTNCLGTGGDTLPYGSRLNNVVVPRGINAEFVDERIGGAGMSYTLVYTIR